MVFLYPKGLIDTSIFPSSLMFLIYPVVEIPSSKSENTSFLYTNPSIDSSIKTVNPRAVSVPIIIATFCPISKSI